MHSLASLASKNEPFFFISDFLASHIEVYPLNELAKHDIFFSFHDETFHKHKHTLEILKPDFETYKQSFTKVIEAIKCGETYVLNYTQETKIRLKSSLKEIYQDANAKFKLFYKNKFICFSPEPFITISDNTIHTYPMKGTIDASIPNAKERILNDKKELAEHTMVVDLLRNDLSQVATQVSVSQFRYVESIQAGDKKLLQISSHIQGKLTPNWKENLDIIIKKLLPAGSISGAPKKSTLQHIKAIESYERDYFCGVMGYFDGKSLQTSVMIRFIEQKKEGVFYKSGGGITIDSDAKKEYEEMLAKIYIP